MIGHLAERAPSHINNINHILNHSWTHPHRISNHNLWKQNLGVMLLLILYASTDRINRKATNEIDNRHAHGGAPLMCKHRSLVFNSN